MYLRYKLEIKFLNKFEKISFLIFFSFAMTLAIGTFIICSHLAEKSCTSLIAGWYNAEAIEIQQGNLYSVLNKAQRTLTGSGMISAGMVYKIQNDQLGPSVFSFGNENFEKLSFVNFKQLGISSKVIGLFKYQISILSNLNGNYVFVFVGEPQHMRLIGLIAMLGFFGAIVFLYLMVAFQTKSRIDVITMAARGISEGALPDRFVKSESPFLVETLSKLLIDIQQKKLREIENASLQSIVNLANQVSHDIRSPLSALNLVIETVKDIPQEQKLLVSNATQRINEIADDLLRKGKSIQKFDSENSNTNLEIKAKNELNDLYDLIPIVDSIIEEKKILVHGKNIKINFTKASSDIKAYFIPTDLKRIISNLLNNALESLNKDEGLITVELNQVSKKVQLSFTDNGKGIPDNILDKVGTMGFSYGKEGSNSSGSGLGLYHAIQTIESFGGKLSIFSKPNEGTMIIIELNC